MLLVGALPLEKVVCGTVALVGCQGGTHENQASAVVLSFIPYHWAPREDTGMRTARTGKHCDHPVTGSDSVGAWRFLHLQISFCHCKLHYSEFSQGLQDFFFFQTTYNKDIRIPVLVLTIASLKAAGQKWGTLGRIKT